jgi:hypothetical protein
MFRNLEQGGIKPVENDLERGFDYKLQDYKILDRQVYLDRLNTKSTPESVADDILLTNSVEFQNQQELYTSVKAGVHTLGAQKVIQKLKSEGLEDHSFGVKKAAQVMGAIKEVKSAWLRKALFKQI